ncbi:MAG TPA: MgtC/SapB family protein [Candidatus Limnocylindria bacterium]|nr:MgtC/SapB family protein [Candidatus Limnocylindria bacterium]
MFDLDLAIRLGAALGLGLLLGLERERKRDAELLFGGVRTFALIALLGALGAFMERELDQGWLILAAFVALSALVIVSYATTAVRGEVGITTEVTALLAFMVGALCGWEQVAVASVATVVCLLLLTLKDFLHGLARRVELADVQATLQFAVISVIILPLLPDQNFGPPPIDVINPYKIWLMVVLIAGLNFLGYVLVKVLGNEHGFIVTGILGGLVSSTAVTLSFSQRSRREPAMSNAFVLAIVVAWTIMFVRVVVVVGLVNRALAASLALALGCMALAGLLVSLLLWRRGRTAETGVVGAGANPFELGEAIKFGVLFGIVTVVAKTAEAYLGATGLYLAGAVAGLTDVDAISLSMANLATASPQSVKIAAYTIVIAVISNTLVKTGMAVFMGAPALRRTIIVVTLLLFAAAGAGSLLT